MRALCTVGLAAVALASASCKKDEDKTTGGKGTATPPAQPKPVDPTPFLALGEMLMTQRPPLRALLISGTFKPDGLLPSPFVGFVRKPFSLEGLLASVTEALETALDASDT